MEQEALIATGDPSGSLLCSLIHLAGTPELHSLALDAGTVPS
jgi:hypothetical protein